MKRVILIISAVAAVSVGVASATPGVGASSHELGRKAVHGFSINEPGSTDIVVVRNTFAPGGSTGWHSHPGVVVIAVQHGEIRLTKGDCTSKTYHTGDVFLERPGNIENGVNNGSVNAVVIATFFGVPRGGLVRIDQPDPGCA